MNTKPKQEKSFRIDRNKLMNVPIDYNDELERANTHPDLLPKPQNPTVKRATPPDRRRSVLAGPTSGPTRDRESGPSVPTPLPGTPNKPKDPVQAKDPGQQVTWADRVRRSPIDGSPPVPSVRKRYFGKLDQLVTRLSNS